MWGTAPGAESEATMETYGENVGESHAGVLEAALSAVEAAYAVATGTPYVLVVDDDGGIVRMLVELLHEEGYATRTASSMRQALQRAPAYPPAVALLDVTLPGEEIAPAVERLRARPGWSSVPVVLCSGRETLAAIARRVGAAAYLRKPFDIDDLFMLLERHAPRKQATN